MRLLKPLILFFKIQPQCIIIGRVESQCSFFHIIKKRIPFIVPFGIFHIIYRYFTIGIHERIIKTNHCFNRINHTYVLCSPNPTN